MQMHELSKEDREALNHLLLEKVERYSVDDRRRELFLYRFGLCDGQIHTLEECAERFGITRERARQVIARILNRNRCCVRTSGLRDFYSP